jgi:hypothetical protein
MLVMNRSFRGVPYLNGFKSPLALKLWICISPEECFKADQFVTCVQVIDDDEDDDIDAGFDDRYNAAFTPAAHHYPSAPQTSTMYNLATGRMLVRSRKVIPHEKNVCFCNFVSAAV